MDRVVSDEPAPKGDLRSAEGEDGWERRREHARELELWPRSLSPRLRMQSRGVVKERKRMGSGMAELTAESLHYKDSPLSPGCTPSTACGSSVDVDDTPSTTSRTVDNSPECQSRCSSPTKRHGTKSSNISEARRSSGERFSKTGLGAWEDKGRPNLRMSPRRRRVLQRYMKFDEQQRREISADREEEDRFGESEDDIEDEEEEDEGEDSRAPIPMVLRVRSEPYSPMSPTMLGKMPSGGRSKVSRLQKLTLLREEGEENEEEADEPVVKKLTSRGGGRGHQQKRRDSFHSLGSHVTWQTLLEYAGDCPEAWCARKVHRWLAMSEKDACIFLSELVELRDALNKGEDPEKQAGPELLSIPTPRMPEASNSASSSPGWFGWMFGYGGRNPTVQAPPPKMDRIDEDQLPQQSGGFFWWLIGGSSMPKVPSTVKPMRFIHSDVVEYHLERLDEVGLLGRGAFGQVTLVRCGDTGQLLALKAVSKGMLVEMQLQHSVMIEKAVMQATSSPFLVKMAATFNRDERLYLLLEAVMGGDLYTVYRRYNFFGSEEHARFYTGCAVCGFQHLHQKRILYRDLKMENLVLDLRGYCKLCDFGTSTFEFDCAYTMCGTPEYMPPEVVCGSGHGAAADWWTLGVLVYEMLMAVTPFAEDEPLQIFAKAKAGIDNVEGFEDICTSWSDLVRGLCKQEPAKRLPMLEGGIANVRTQDWFRDANFDWNSLEAGRMKAPHIPECKGPEDRCNFAGEEQEVPLDLPYVDPGDEWDKGFEDPVGPRHVAAAAA